MTSPFNDRADWHRILGLILLPLFDLMGYHTDVEVDLSLKKQLADIITVSRDATGWIPPDLPPDFWAVFDNLNDHNIITLMYTKEDFWRDYPIPWEKEVRAKGERKALVLMMQRVIALRFEVELGHFETVLQDLPFAGVKHLSDLIFEVDTLAEFEAAVTQTQSQFPLEPS